jgi:hypothetical protein
MDSSGTTTGINGWIVTEYNEKYDQNSRKNQINI